MKRNPTDGRPVRAKGRWHREGGLSFMLEDDDMTAILNSVIDRSLSGTLYIPSTVKADGRFYRVVQINPLALSRCVNLTRVVVPDSVENIQLAAFCDCASLEEIELPPSLKHIGPAAFSGCDNLCRIKIKL